MEDTTVAITGIIVAAIIMFLVPLILVADRSDDISQLLVQTLTAEFVDEVMKNGKITNNQYQNFISRLASSGNAYEIDMEVKILDENTSKIGGNNTYYSIFTSQIEEIIGVSALNTNNNSDGKIILKQGDEISVTVKNSGKTFSQLLKNFYYNIVDSDIQIITATASGTIAIDGVR